MKQGKITSDTITNEEIRELQRTSVTDGNDWWVCVSALTGSRAAREVARTRCAEIINARAAGAK